MPRGIGSFGKMDDSFYIAEEVFEEAGKLVGIKPKKNIHLRVTKEIERKLHATHSPLQKIIRFREQFKRKSPLDVKISILKKRLKRI